MADSRPRKMSPEMTHASIRAAAEHIARAGTITPHQLAALDAVWASMSAEQKRKFTEDWRAQGSPAALPLQQALNTVTTSSPFSAQLTPHIRLGEFALEQEARRFDRQYQISTAIELAKFLERVRAQFSGPIIITSGYRPPAVNRSVGGASGSEHLFSAPKVGAVDFYVKGASIKAVQDWCDINWPYSLGYGAPKGFVHLGMRAGKPKVRWNY